jgi:hypothetical protein
MDRRKQIVEILTNLAPGRPTGRIWGRAVGAGPNTGCQDNVWAADPEDLADLILLALEER